MAPSQTGGRYDVRAWCILTTLLPSLSFKICMYVHIFFVVFFSPTMKIWYTLNANVKMLILLRQLFFISDMTSYYEMVYQIGGNRCFIIAVFEKWAFWSSWFLFLLFLLLDILSLRGQYIWSESLNWLVDYTTLRHVINLLIVGTLDLFYTTDFTIYCTLPKYPHFHVAYFVMFCAQRVNNRLVFGLKIKRNIVVG